MVDFIILRKSGQLMFKNHHRLSKADAFYSILIGRNAFKKTGKNIMIDASGKYISSSVNRIKIVSLY
jgi:hypothetical protein